MSECYFVQNKTEEKKMNETILDELKKKLQKEKILSCLILKDNSLIFEFYKNSKISGSLQTINSCTKSIVSALLGTLVDNGLIRSVHIPITEFLGDIINKQTEERVKEITIYNLLTMTPGFHWPEFGEWNCFSPMVYSNDIVKFILLFSEIIPNKYLEKSQCGNINIFKNLILL